MLNFGEVKVLSSAPFEYVEHIFASSLKVGGGIIWAANEDLGSFSEVGGLKIVAHRDKLLTNVSKEGEPRSDFLFGSGSLDGGADHSDKPTFGGDLMGVAYDWHVNI